MRRSIVACAALLSLSLTAAAAPPSVAVDIAPLHSLVSQVMGRVAQPNLIIPAEASPHQYSLRPSQARSLANADIVFWIGESYTPWLEKSLETLASSAQKIEVLEIKGTTTYAFRESATFASHDHGHDDHEEEGHHEEDDHKDEHHEESDPHAWLDPENAKVWVNHINDVLSTKDPENAATYSRNAAAAIDSLNALIAATHVQIKTLEKPAFIVFHDAYQYFEKRFGVAAAGSISLSDAENPSPARVKEIQDTVKKLGVTCIFTEPQYNAGLVNNVFAGTSISTIGVMDPLGASIATGSRHYQSLIKGMVVSISQCQ